LLTKALRFRSADLAARATSAPSHLTGLVGRSPSRLPTPAAACGAGRHGGAPVGDVALIVVIATGRAPCSWSRRSQEVLRKEACRWHPRHVSYRRRSGCSVPARAHPRCGPATPIRRSPASARCRRSRDGDRCVTRWDGRPRHRWVLVGEAVADAHVRHAIRGLRSHATVRARARRSRCPFPAAPGGTGL